MALDLDGTIRSAGGVVRTSLITQFEALKRSGVKLLLVTGRALIDLEPLIDIEIFDVVVLENGALMRMHGHQRSLVPEGWAAERRKLVQVFPTVGHEREIVSLERDRLPVVKAILAEGVAHIEFNKNMMMILPSGVSKGSGLRAALEALDIPPANAMCIGDGENDVALLRAGGIKVAVKNAVPGLKAVADYVTEGENGEGVSEAIAKFCGAAA